MSIRALAQRYINDTGIDPRDLAEAIGYSRTTVGRYLTGERTSEGVDRAMAAYLAEQGYEADTEPEPSPAPLPPLPALYPSRDATGVIGLCSQCQDEGALGIVTGRPGTGKTHALERYAATTPKTVYVYCDDTMGKKDFVRAIERGLDIPRASGTACERTDAIGEFFRANRGWLLVIDEADKLISRSTIQKMEIIRKFVDRAPVGVVIAGEPVLEVLLKNYDKRFADRIDLHLELGGLTAKEVRGYLEGYEVTEDAAAELTRRACDKASGCFRRLDRTMRNVRRLLETRGDRCITLPVISEASAMMLI